MADENFKFVIVGHVDHGKSTLIGRLLFDTNSLPEGKIEEIKAICESLGKELEFGYIMDNLEEERDQNITIDTAQIFFKTKKREYTIIDAPGHVEFVKNMITGASQAEAAILIVDAEEGIQEQTRRHSYILSMLGLKQVIVVMNKMDRVDYKKERFEEVKEELIKFLDSIKIKPSYIIPISAKEGDNVAEKSEKMKWYKGPIVLEALDIFKPNESNNNKPLRFSVQDIYMWDKRIIAGRVETGILKAGDEIVVLPSGEKTTIESIEEFLKENIKEAESGKATGIVTKDKVFLDRGNIICKEDSKPTVTDKFTAQIFWLSKDPLKKGERIILKCSTQQAICEVEEFGRIIDSSTLEEIKDRDEIRNREAAVVTLKTDKPIVVENFNKVEELGRFVLERLNTCAGGIITGV
ncbi:GTP-binding protein [Candidatus Woesearchaeota archaeon]|nr:GTP-binding protein [Candidatus Woesearchaeota archaeon]